MREPGAVGQRVYPCFDGLRAIAAIAILVTHVAFGSGAIALNAFGPFLVRLDGGVAIFFVISGFLLYRPFVIAHVTGRPAPATLAFWWRRFLRIYPAYWFVITVILYVFADAQIHSVKKWVLDYSLMNVYFTGHRAGPLPPSWTLSVEVAFYVLVPIWAFLVARWDRGSPSSRIRRELLGIAVLVAASVAWKTFVLTGDFSAHRELMYQTWLPWSLDLFAVGMLFAVGSVAIQELGRPTPLRLDQPWAPALCWLLAAGGFWLVAKGVGLPNSPFSIPNHLQWGRYYLHALIAAFLVAPAVFGPQTRDSLIRRFLTTRVLVYLGVVSYGIYLWHVPMFRRYLQWTDQMSLRIYNGDVPFAWATGRYFSVPFLVCLLAVLALTVGAATVSWYFVERPALRLKHLGRLKTKAVAP